MSYSQRDEERYILKACESATRRRVLDIGAFHPTVMSNSRALIEAGWQAVLIEPSPGPLRNLVQEYGRNVDVTVVAAAACLGGGWIQMAVTDDAVSSSNEQNVSKWSAAGGYFGTMIVPCITIPDILHHFGAFDMVSIDVEGGSVDLLKALLATEMFPRCIVCEYDDRLAEAQMAAHKRGYKTMHVTTENLVREAPKFGVDQVLVYDDAWLLKSPFYEAHKEWWKIPDSKYNQPNRGFGWFIWKPWVINHALATYAQPGDIVLFVDGDTYPIADLTPLYQECERINGIMLFEELGCEHQHWCKRDTFIVMGMDEDRWRFRQHACARFMLFQRNRARSSYFLEEWLKYCLNRDANTFDASRLAPEYPELHEPRCEQAILTNLAHKYSHRLYRTACQFGESSDKDRELYGQLFVQQECENHKKHDYSGSRFRNV